MKKKLNTKAMVLMGMLTAILILFSFTPIGSIPVGPLVITLNVIPVAIAAIALGPIGGAAMGAVFGLFSFLQCFGIGIRSEMGAVLAQINPFLAFVQRFVPRTLDGFLVGLIFKGMSRAKSDRLFYSITGLITALFTLGVFMSGMLVFNHDKEGKYGMTADMYDLIITPELIVYICVFVGILSFLLGYTVIKSKKLSRAQVACATAGFCTAILNTIFFMGALVLLFKNTEYLQNIIAGRNILIYIIATVGVNALFEMVVATLVAGAVGNALCKAKFIEDQGDSVSSPEKKSKKEKKK